MTAIKSLCQDSILLANGQIAAQGGSSEIVNKYLITSTLQATERQWKDPQEAPGNEMIRFKSARVSSHAPNGIFDVHTPIDIGFEIWSFLEDVELNFSLVLYTNEEVCVLNTISDRVPCSRGVVKGICHIPGNFLNDAVYRVRILVVEDSKPIFDDANILSFEVVEGVRMGGWHGKWVGVVRPKFEWDIGNAE
jgi:lipopolysaccharide transport system ATP-binding protein